MALLLIVQSSDQARSDTAATLRAEGHEVLEAASAEDAVSLSRAWRPAVILLDPLLPGETGDDLYVTLQRELAGLATQILFLPVPPLPPPAAGAEAEAGAEAAGPVLPEPLLGGLELVTRVGLALRAKAVHDQLDEADTALPRQLPGGLQSGGAGWTDPLTGLANRRACAERLAAACRRAAAGAEPVALVLADLDHFARVNEAVGYAAGDQALQLFAGLLHESCRGGDTAGRWEGATWVLILPGIGLEPAWYVAERVRLRTAALTKAIGTERVALSASLGVAEYQEGDLWTDLFGRAETALARAKRSGRNRAEVA
ncbi:MAG TPA: diguanylate cyclase [Actinomycetota bacterium]